MLHPDNDFNVERTLLKDDVQKLIKVSAYSGRVVGSGGGGRGEWGWREGGEGEEQCN